MNRVQCSIWWDDNIQAYCSSTPSYSEEFVESSKSAIPRCDRQYYPDMKVWAFPEKYLEAVLDAARKVWKETGEVVCIFKRDIEKVHTEFIRLLPPDALKAAYRSACMEFHPDRGGSPDKMAQLNDLWDRIQIERGIK